MLLTGDLQNSRNRLIVILQNMTQIVGYMLVDENNPNIISLSESFQRVFDGLWPCILLHCEEVARLGCSVPYSSEEETGDGILISDNSN